MVSIYAPNAVLAPFVECYNVLSGHFESRTHSIVSARGVPMLMFPFNKPSLSSFKHGAEGSSYAKPILDEPALLTCSNTFGDCSFEGDINFVMVLLKTTGAYHFLQSSVKGISNTAYTFDHLGLYRYFEPLQDQLWSIQQPAEAVRLIQQYLTKYLEQKSKIGPGDFSPVMQYMLRHPATLQVGDIARKFKCSERWIEKQCAIQTGLPPKSWLRLIRFRSAANYWLRRPDASWMELVANFQYNDQSHLIKDFHEFTGNSPVHHFAQHGHSETMLKQHEAGLSGLIDRAA